MMNPTDFGTSASSTPVERPPKADFIVEDHGSICIFRPMSGEALSWAKENVQIPDYMWIGGGFACEHGCAAALYSGIVENGFTVAD